MESVIRSCAGLDVHRSMITACALLSDEHGRARKLKSQFVTTRSGLERLAAWLRGLGVTDVGMESTGVYWMPVFAVLEAAGAFKLLVLNPEHVKGMKGRKSDIKDAEWLADLVRHGLVRGSFVPPKPIRELRDLTRYRRTLVENQGSERRRLIKLLEAADVKLAGVISDIFGVSRRAILRALIEGGHSAVEMSKLVRGKLRQKCGLVIDALAGELAEHQRDILAMQLARVEADEADIAALDRLIGERLAPYAAQMALLVTIPGIDWVAATVIAEIGVDMSVFPSHRHLAAWGGTCPGNNESAGKRKPIGAQGEPLSEDRAVQCRHRCFAQAGQLLQGQISQTQEPQRWRARRPGDRAQAARLHLPYALRQHLIPRGRRGLFRPARHPARRTPLCPPPPRPRFLGHPRSSPPAPSRTA